MIETNIACQFPVGHYGRIAPRSGLAVRQGIFINAGVIDPDYRGTLKVLLVNYGTQALEISKGMKIAQLILERYGDAIVQEVSALPDSVRSDKCIAVSASIFN